MLSNVSSESFTLNIFINKTYKAKNVIWKSVKNNQAQKLLLDFLWQVPEPIGRVICSLLLYQETFSETGVSLVPLYLRFSIFYFLYFPFFINTPHISSFFYSLFLSFSLNSCSFPLSHSQYFYCFFHLF